MCRLLQDGRVTLMNIIALAPLSCFLQSILRSGSEWSLQKADLIMTLLRIHWLPITLLMKSRRVFGALYDAALASQSSLTLFRASPCCVSTTLAFQFLECIRFLIASGSSHVLFFLPGMPPLCFAWQTFGHPLGFSLIVTFSEGFCWHHCPHENYVVLEPHLTPHAFLHIITIACDCLLSVKRSGTKALKHFFTIWWEQGLSRCFWINTCSQGREWELKQTFAP